MREPSDPAPRPGGEPADVEALAEIPLDDRTASALDELSLWSSRFGAMMLDRLPLVPGSRVLDLACGSGFPALEIAARLGATARVVGLDRWLGALRRGEEKRRFHGLDPAHFVGGDGARLPFRDASFDLVTSNLGINNFDDAPAAFAEAARVLMVGGSIVLTTNVSGHMAEFYREFRDVLERIGDAAALERLGANEAHRGSAASVCAALETGGFTVQDVVEDRFALRFATGSALLRHPLVRIGFLPAWRDVVGAENRAVVFERLRERLDERAAGGDLSTTVPMLYVRARR